MKSKTQTDAICEKLQLVGFNCTGCADCCRDCGDTEETVMVGPDEIRRISSFTGMEWDEIAVPFPDIITTGDGCQFTFGWSVRRKEKECIFLYRNRCSIYEVRPRICSTYPFMLEEGEIRTFPCNGLMHPIEKKAAMDLAERLQDRYNKESDEDRKMKENYIMYPVIAKKFCIIDAEGRKVR